MRLQSTPAYRLFHPPKRLRISFDRGIPLAPEHTPTGTVALASKCAPSYHQTQRRCSSHPARKLLTRRWMYALAGLRRNPSRLEDRLSISVSYHRTSMMPGSINVHKHPCMAERNGNGQLTSSRGCQATDFTSCECSISTPIHSKSASGNTETSSSGVRTADWPQHASRTFPHPDRFVSAAAR